MNSGISKAPQLGHSAYGLVGIWKKGAGLGRLSRFGVAWHLFCQALRSMRSSPLTTLLCVLTISVVLFLFAAFELAVENVSDFLGASQSKLTISIYLKDAASESQKDKLLAEITRLPEVLHADYRSKADALAEFRKDLGDQNVILEGLDEDNPLPASIEVSFSKKGLDADVFGIFEKRFAKSEVVERIGYNRGLVGQLGAVVHFFKLAGLVAIAAMLLISGFIIANTIRLALYSRKDELGVMRLVGAASWFVGTPCLIEGVLHGLLGSVVGLASLHFVFGLLISLFQGLGFFEFAAGGVHFLSWKYQLLVFVVGTLVGLAGSYFAVRRFIDD